MANYNLTSNLTKDFSFTIDDKEFLFRKPTVREARAMQQIYAEMDKDASPEEQARLGEQAMREMYKFVTSVGHSEDIMNVMDSQPVDVQIAFNEMVQKELGA